MAKHAGQFKKGQSGNPAGKPKGTQAKITADVKRMIETAVEKAGERTQKRKRSLKSMEPGIAYLTEQAEKNPTAFLSLLGKVLPRQLDVNMTITSKEVLGKMQDRRNALAALKARALENVEDAEYIEVEPDPED